MSYERAEFRDALRKRQQESTRRHLSEIRQMAQAEVPIQHLTESREWDYLLSIIQKQIEVLDGLLQACILAFIANPSFAQSDLAEQKAQMVRLEVQRDTLRSVLALPADIMKLGEKAKLVLKDYADE